jgi:hypothetical protein
MPVPGPAACARCDPSGDAASATPHSVHAKVQRREDDRPHCRGVASARGARRTCSFPQHPFGLSVSKPCPCPYVERNEEGFDTLSPNGDIGSAILRAFAPSREPALPLPSAPAGSQTCKIASDLL